MSYCAYLQLMHFVSILLRKMGHYTRCEEGSHLCQGFLTMFNTTPLISKTSLLVIGIFLINLNIKVVGLLTGHRVA